MLQDRCLEFACSFLYGWKDGECVRKFHDVALDGLTFNLRLVPLEEVDVQTAFDYTTHIAKNVFSILTGYNISLRKFDPIVFALDLKDIPINETTNTICRSLITFVEFKFFLLNLTTEYAVNSLITFLQDHQFNIEVNVGKIKFNSEIVQHNQSRFPTHTINDFNISLCKYTELFVSLYAYDLYFTDSVGSVYIMKPSLCVSLAGQVTSILDVHTRIDIVSLLNCTQVVLPLANESWVQTTDGSLLLYEQWSIDSTLYFFVDEQNVRVCKDAYLKYLSTFSNKTFSPKDRYSLNTVISIICSSFSVIGLSTTLLTFCALPKLRQKLPGKNNMTLVTVMLIAQVVYISSSVRKFNSGSGMCFVVGFLVHFLWLLSVFWMNICTYHMFRVFVRMELVQKTDHQKRFMCYHAYACVSALVFTFSNVLASRLTYGTLGYGLLACYISYPDFVLYFFAFPVTLVILCNILMFSYVICKISLAPTVKKYVENERNDLIIFAKLSTLTGVSWVFGLVNVWIEEEALDYIFSILNASQGVFIFIAFVINKRVSNTFKERFSSMTTSSVAKSDPKTN